MHKIQENPVGSIFGKEELNIIKKLLEDGSPLTRGKEIDEFEKKFSNYCDSKYAVAVSSCGGALHIASQLLNLKEGDEVICQANAFWITINQLLQRKVKIRCCDVDGYSLNINPKKIKDLITKKTKAIYVMHYGGNPADLDTIREYGIPVVEDAAHANGSKYNGRKIGSDSDIACFSMSTLKNITTLGEGGMIITNRKEWDEQARLLRTGYPIGITKKREPSYGIYKKPRNPAFMRCGDYYDVDYTDVQEIGTTFRMTTIQAAVGMEQLKKIDTFNKMREEIAKRYDEINGIIPMDVLPSNKNSWHLYACFVDTNRDKIIDILEKKYKIFLTNRFPPVNLWGVMRYYGHQLGECPLYERIWFEELINLPINPSMKESEIEYICDSLEKVVNENT